MTNITQYLKTEFKGNVMDIEDLANSVPMKKKIEWETDEILGYEFEKEYPLTEDMQQMCLVLVDQKKKFGEGFEEFFYIKPGIEFDKKLIMNSIDKYFASQGYEVDMQATANTMGKVFHNNEGDQLGTLVLVKPKDSYIAGIIYNLKK